MFHDPKMDDELTYFYNRDNLQDILEKHPEYTKVYFKITNANGKMLLSLCRDTGDELYLVSNKRYDDLNLYLRKRMEIQPVKKKVEEVKTQTMDNIKKPKQQTLFGFIKKN